MSERISKKQTKDLLATGGGTRRDDLRVSAYDTSGYYALSDGQILVDLSDARHSVVFGSEDEYQAFLGTVNKPPSHILHGFPSTVAGFQKLAAGSREDISQTLHVEGLDDSFPSLQRIDAAMKKHRVSYMTYREKLFKPLVAYVSQVIIMEKKGAWDLRTNVQFNIVEPYILLPAGRAIQVFTDLAEFAEEDYKNFTVYGTAQLRLDQL
jgi:hypothetical protein